MERNRFERRKRNSRRNRPEIEIGRDRPQRGIVRNQILNRRDINTMDNTAPDLSTVNVGSFKELLNRLSNLKRKR